MDAANALESLSDEEVETVASRALNGKHSSWGVHCPRVVGDIAAGAKVAAAEEGNALCCAVWGGLLFGFALAQHIQLLKDESESP